MDGDFKKTSNENKSPVIVGPPLFFISPCLLHELRCTFFKDTFGLFNVLLLGADVCFANGSMGGSE